MVEDVLIKISEDGAKVVRKELEGIGTSAKKASSNTQLLKRALSNVGTFLLVNELKTLADTYTTVQNRLKNVTSSTEELEVVTEKLFEIANKTRSPFASISELFARVALSAKVLGKSQQELLDFTESLSQAVILSGANAIEAEKGIVQLTQGIASGRLQGDELRSVLEQLPIVADVIAKQMGVTRGELRKLGREGKLTGDVIIAAFTNARKELNEKFAKSVPTLQQSFVVLRNSIIQFIGETDKAFGISKALAQAILFLSQNMELIGKIATAAGIFISSNFVKKGVYSAIAAVRALTLAIAANPIGALIIALTAAVSLMIAFSDQIKLSSDGAATLQDFLVSIFSNIFSFLKTLGEGFKIFFQDFLKIFSNIFQDVDLQLKDFIMFVAIVFDSFIALSKFAVNAVIKIFQLLPVAIAEIFIKVINFLLEKTEDFINFFGDAISEVTDFVGLGEIGKVKIGRIFNPFEGASKELGDALVSEFNQMFEPGPIANAVLGAFQDAEDRAKKRIDEEAKKKLVDLDKKGKNLLKNKGKEDKELEKLKRELIELENSVDPVLAAERELAGANDILQKAVKRLNLEESKATEIYNKKKEQLKSQLDPLRALHEELNQQIALAKLDNKEREVTSRLLEIENDLKSKGIKLNQFEKGAIAEKLKQLQSLENPEEKVMSAADSPLISYLSELQTAATLMQNTLVTAFQKIEDAIVDFVTTGEFNFKKFVDSVIADLTRLFVRQALIQLLGSIVTGVAPNTATGRGVAALPGFQYGGNFMVGGQGGPDSKIVAFRATPGEKVSVTPKNRQQRSDVSSQIVHSGGPYYINIQTPNPKSFNSTAAQTANEIRRGIRIAHKRNGG